jgi:hypothetical protein
MEGFDDSEPAMSPAGVGLLDHFSALRDPRQNWRVIYPLPEILLLVLCATLSGMEDFVEIRLWGDERLDFLRRFLPYERRLPSHDTLNDLLNALDADLFKTCFVNWIETLRESEPDIIAIDGKTSRRCHARGKGREPLHMVSAWATRQRLVLGQQAVDEKSNEITAIPLLLERLQLAGALVTIDAIGAQAEIADKIVARGGDFLFALKENQPTLLDDVRTFFDDPPADMLEPAYATTDGDHRRIEERRHLVSHDVDWLANRDPKAPRFPRLGMIGMVESRVERDGAQAPPATLLSLVRPARREGLRGRRPRPLERREPAPLGSRRRLPRRPRAPAHRPWPRQHGRRQAHGHEPRPQPKRPTQPQGPKKTRKPQPRLSRNPHPPDRPLTQGDSPERR